VIATNAITIPAQTNTATGEVDARGSSRINWRRTWRAWCNRRRISRISRWRRSCQTASARGTAASAAGTPWSHTAAEIALARLGALLSWTNLRERQQLVSEISSHTDTQSELSQAQDVAQTLVQNFEQLRQAALTIPVTRAD